MKRHIISYLTPERALGKLSEDDQVLHVLEPYGRIKLRINDEVWMVSVRRGSGELYLIGHIVVGQLTGFSNTRSYITAKPGTEEELRVVSLVDDAPLLRFKSKVVGADRLEISNDGRVNAMQFSSPRILTEESAIIIARKWAEAVTKEELIAIEEELEQRGEFGAPNPLVEEAAVLWVTEHYEEYGWKVRSKEAEKIGYDLLCTQGHEERHVEVKGLLRRDSSFFMTYNEKKRAEEDPDFRIAIVIEALSPRHEIEILDGEELSEEFDFKPLEYRVSRK